MKHFEFIGNEFLYFTVTSNLSHIRNGYDIDAISIPSHEAGEKRLKTGNTHDVAHKSQRHDSALRICRHFFMTNKRLGIYGLTFDLLEKTIILETIEYCDGNISKAARILFLSERTLHNKLKRYRQQMRQEDQQLL